MLAPRIHAPFIQLLKTYPLCKQIFSDELCKEYLLSVGLYITSIVQVEDGKQLVKYCNVLVSSFPIQEFQEIVENSHHFEYKHAILNSSLFRTENKEQFNRVRKVVLNCLQNYVQKHEDVSKSNEK